MHSVRRSLIVGGALILAAVPAYAQDFPHHANPIVHGGTSAQPHGGKVADLSFNWLEWQLRGDRAAAATFVGPDCGLRREASWTVLTKGIR